MSKRSHEFSGPGGEDDEQNLCRAKRNRILPPRETKSVQVFAKVPPGTNGHVLVDFLNYMMKKEGMIEHERDGIIRYQSLLENDQCWCLVMPSETLAEELCYLNGISFQEEPDVFITLCRHSCYSNSKPRFTGWNSYYRFKYNGNSPQIECCVFACISEGTDANELRELLNDKMKDYFYAFITEEELGPILACNSFPKSGQKKFMVYLSTPELAEKLLWLDGIHVKDLKINLNRHKEYRGPPPKYPSFGSFRQSGEYKIQIEVLVNLVNQKPSKNTREELFKFLTDQLHHYRLVSERERLIVRIVRLLGISKAENTWKAFVANPKIACILAYFDYVPWNGTVLRIKRDRDYHGPPPLYRNFRHLQREYDPLNSDSPPKITPEKTSQPQKEKQIVLSDTATLVRANTGTFVRRVSQNIEQDSRNEKERGSKRTESLSKSSERCSTNDDELMELRDRVRGVSSKLETTQNKLTEVTGELSMAKSCRKVVTGQYEAYRNQVDEKAAELAVAKSQNETTQKQLTEITGELTTTKKERDDLQSRLMNVTGQFESTRKQWIDVTGELATTKKQRDDFQSRLKDVTSQLETAQTRLAEGTGELITAKKQRDDIHDSWQHQAVELIDKQEEIDNLKRKLEDMSKNLNTLVDSMTLQKSELIRERNARSELEGALRASSTRAGFTQNTPFHRKKEEAKNPE